MGLVPALIEGGTAIASALIGHHAATTAANQQVTAAKQASAGLQQPVDIGNFARAKQAAMFGYSPAAAAIPAAARAMAAPTPAMPPVMAQSTGATFSTAPAPAQPMMLSAFANPQNSIPINQGGIPIPPPTTSAYRRTP